MKIHNAPATPAPTIKLDFERELKKAWSKERGLLGLLLNRPNNAERKES